MRKSPLYEVVGQLGMWGTLINGIQAAGLEHKAMRTASWNGTTSKHLVLSSKTLEVYELTWWNIVGLLVAYTAAMFILYTVAPILYRMASSAYYNLSLLSSDFYGLLFGLFLFVCISRPHTALDLRCLPFPEIALQAILALLCRFCCCHPWFGDLFLECRTYVSHPFK